MGFIKDILDLIPDNPKARIEVRAETFEQSLCRVNAENARARVKAEVLAIERMEKETNSTIKRRMQLLIERGVYDFTGIENW